MSQTTSLPPSPSASSDRRRRTWWYVGGAALLVLILLGVGIWYFVFRDDSPPAVDIERASETAQEAGGSQGETSFDGTWRIDSSIGSFDDFTGTFVGYRVQEELVGIGAKTAVGRTPDVEGQLRIEGTTIPEASFTANLTTLKSDEGRRDNALRGQALETDRFPIATFVLTEPIELEQIPPEGETIEVDATGDLTLHGVTKEVTIPLQAERSGDVITVTGQLDIQFADFDISQPTSFAVLSIEDHGIVEVQLFFTKE